MTQQSDVVFFFGDSAERKSLYQLRQWVGPLVRLAAKVSVTVVCSTVQAADTAKAAGLPFVKGTNLAEAIYLAKSLKPKVILYPNMFYENYPIWGESSAKHVFVSHGESDKSYMSQNAIKFFDYLYVAGDMAISRIRQNVQYFDLSRCIKIGRPQLLDPVPAPPKEFVANTDQRKVVLYAPTWEGSLIQNRYGSVASHGLQIVESILSKSDQFRLVYKPHPFTGSMITSWGEANDRIKNLIRSHPSNHFVDESAFGWQPAISDIMITDVSAVAYDWLATGKPIVLTKPAEPQAELFTGGIFGELPLMQATQAAEAANWVERALNDPATTATVSAWSKKYYQPALDSKGQELFVTETMKLVQANTAVWPELKPFKANGPSLKKRIARLLPLDTKLFISKSMEFLLNGSVAKSSQIALYMTGAKPSQAFLAELDQAFDAKVSLLIISPLNFLRIKLATLTNPKLRRKISPHLVTNAQSVATAVQQSGAKELMYLSHSMDNHFGLRLNGLKHTFTPLAHGPKYNQDHNLVAYDDHN